MFTSDRNDLRTAFRYLIISVLLAFGGAVYEMFSFGVYSYFMIYAFAVPLCMGAIPFMTKYMLGLRKDETAGGERYSAVRKWSGELYHSAVAALTIGSIVQGALEICGRPNHLVAVYPMAAIVLLLMSLLLMIPVHLRTRSII